MRRGFALLLDLRGLATELTEVVQLGPAHVASGCHFDLGDVRRVHREGALHADSEGHLRTVKVSRRPAPWRRITTPWKICTASADPSMTRTWTFSVSPGRKLGMSVRSDAASRSSRVFIVQVRPRVGNSIRTITLPVRLVPGRSGERTCTHPAAPRTTAPSAGRGAVATRQVCQMEARASKPDGRPTPIGPPCDCSLRLSVERFSSSRSC